MRHYIVITLLIISINNSANALSTLHCDFDKILSTYSCNPISLNPPITQENEEIAVNGTHLSGLAHEDVTYVRFNSPLTFHFVPTKLFEIFPNIETIGMQNVNLSNLTSNAFTNCYRLKSLTIDRNMELSEIPEGFAENCGNLKNLYLPGNAIEEIDKNAFNGLDNLLYLVLTKNNIEQLQVETFKPLRNLQHLFIDHNKLKHFHSDLFYPLRKLQLLSLTHNDIEEVSAELFRNNPILDSLFFDYNEIIAIDGKFFNIFPGERETFEIRFCGNNCTNAIISNKVVQNSVSDDDFDVCIENWNITRLTSDNEIHAEISSTSTTDMTMTETINIHERDCRYFLNENRKYTCVLECVDLVLTAIGGAHYKSYSDLDVTRVYFSRSTLSKVPKIIFEKFPNLEFLSVASTQLMIINDQTFGECGRLKEIDASGNDIREIVETSLKNCTELVKIDVSGNPIEFIDGEIFNYDPQLKHIIFNRRF
ncbi:hypothetical protein PVAND_013293 [Polypedilum vanderplanki]|uniref:Leucine rich repeat protein n=1 Tax=Polypedilum vanderplanki TaxID=319348 RepID=A0A9J6CQ12_POLVA|nr:hypothetical protein PVAND_013293 [Polypedilum vanderplanki]